MRDHDQSVIQKAIQMSNNKPFVTGGADILKHITPDVKVRVYRNLHKNCMSVQQGGLVKCHANSVILKNFRAVVNPAGRDRVRLEKAKNVHAYIEGFVVSDMEVYRGRDDYTELYYNPYKTDHWIELNTGKFVDCGECCWVGTDVVLAYNVLYREKTC